MSEPQDPTSGDLNEENAGNPPPPPPPPPGGEPIGYASGDQPTKDEMTMGMLCHVLALAGYIIPLGNVIGPLVIWLVKKDQSAFVDDQGKESLNFQITVLIATVISIALLCVGIGVILLPVVGIVALVFIIIAAVQASKGERYRYPMTIRFIK